MRTHAPGTVLAALLTLAIGSCGPVDWQDIDAGSGGSRYASAVIGPAGGYVEIEDGPAVGIPQGALEEDVEIGIEIVDEPPAELPDQLVPVSDVVALTPHGLLFAEPVTITIPFDSQLTASLLAVLRLEDEQDSDWEVVPEVSFDSAVAILESNTFSFYTVSGPEEVDGGSTDAGDDDDGGDDAGIHDGGVLDGGDDGGDYDGAYPDGSDLDGSDLDGGVLDGGDDGGDYDGTYPDGSDLDGSDLDGGDLDGGNYDGGDVDGGGYDGTYPDGGDYDGAYPDGGDLDGGDYDGSDVDGGGYDGSIED